MSLFKKKQKAPAAAPEPIMESTFTRASGFKGFKRFRVTVHGIEEAEANSVKMRDMDMKGAEIVFRVFRDVYKNEYAMVCINGSLVGIVYDEDQIAEIKGHAFEKVYAMFEDENVVTQKETITRPRIRLFVKYKEEA